MKAARAGTQRPGIAVFDADAPTAIAFTRSLGRRGIPVQVYSPRTVTAAGASRYASATLRCPPLELPEEFLPWLEQRLRSGEIHCVAPTSDQVAFYLAELETLLPGALRRVLPAANAVHRALFKDLFAVALEQARFASPPTAFPTSTAEAIAAASALRFPLVLKPRAHVAAGLARGTVVHTVEELTQAFGPCEVDASNRLPLARYPSLRFPLMQEYVPGALQHLYSVSGVLGPQGEVVAVSGSRKTGQWPPLLGVGVRFEPWHDAAVIAQGAQLAKRILGQGIFELELIWDEARQAHVAIDLNPRAHGQISLDIARGHDLPWMWYRMYRGETLFNVPPPTDVPWRHALPFHAGHLAQLAKGPNRPKAATAYFHALRERAVDIVLDRKDVLPGVIYTARMLRHPGGLLRPFLG